MDDYTRNLRCHVGDQNCAISSEGNGWFEGIERPEGYKRAKNIDQAYAEEMQDNNSKGWVTGVKRVRDSQSASQVCPRRFRMKLSQMVEEIVG